jgi:hypothetical protein
MKQIMLVFIVSPLIALLPRLCGLPSNKNDCFQMGAIVGVMAATIVFTICTYWRTEDKDER